MHYVHGRSYNIVLKSRQLLYDIPGKLDHDVRADETKKTA